jgi:hypothetical protein
VPGCRSRRARPGAGEAIGAAMEAVLRDAGPARGVFEGLLGDEAG